MKVDGTGLAVMASSSTTQMLLMWTDSPFRIHGSGEDVSADPGFQARRLVRQATPPIGQAALACLVVYKREWVSDAAVPEPRKTNAS